VKAADDVVRAGSKNNKLVVQTGDTSGQVGPRYRLVSQRQDGSAAFQKGVTLFRQGTMSEALGSFEQAASAESENALYQYYRALAMFSLAGAQGAEEALQKAVELEKSEPIKDWGKRMERVQGRGRVWVEQARRATGLAR
jgi:tetratricopeptide (TPR) repeat protein